MRKRSGFTLIETMVVTSVVGIAMTIALPSAQQMIAAQKIKTAASTLQSALFLTRSEAIKRNTTVTLAPVGEQWEGGWRITLPDDSVLSSYGEVKAVTITAVATSIAFQGAGRLNGASGTTFKLASTDTPTIRCVSIGLSGVPTVSSSGC